jgi:hypothetical protein
MNVFISRFYEDTIGGVFTTREAAQEDCDRHNAKPDVSGWEVEQWEVQGAFPHEIVGPVDPSDPTRPAR